MNINLKEVNRDNLMECIDLKVSEEQDGFVTSNVFSIAEAKVEETFKPMCIYDGDTMVGFIMYGIDIDDGNVWVSRLMIDKNHQRKGYGRAAMIKAIDTIKNEYEKKEIYLSTEPENKVAQKLYEGLGFRNTGKIICNEVVFIKEI